MTNMTNILPLHLQAFWLALRDTYRDWQRQRLIEWEDRNTPYSEVQLCDGTNGYSWCIYTCHKDDASKMKTELKRRVRPIDKCIITIPYADVTLWWMGEKHYDRRQTEDKVHSWYLHNQETVIAYWNSEIDEDQFYKSVTRFKLQGVIEHERG